VFSWDEQPLFVPYSEFEAVFADLNPASDGQYKVQVYQQGKGTELYVANAGRFNVESYMGWLPLKSLVKAPAVIVPRTLLDSANCGISIPFD
jgi:hypothetical protein